MENKFMLFIILQRVYWLIIKGYQVSKIFNDISFSLLLELEISGEYVFIACKLLKSENRDHYLAEKTQIISTVALQIEVFAETVNAAIVETGIC